MITRKKKNQMKIKSTPDVIMVDFIIDGDSYLFNIESNNLDKVSALKENDLYSGFFIATTENDLKGFTHFPAEFFVISKEKLTSEKLKEYTKNKTHYVDVLTPDGEPVTLFPQNGYILPVKLNNNNLNLYKIEDFTGKLNVQTIGSKNNAFKTTNVILESAILENVNEIFDYCDLYLIRFYYFNLFSDKFPFLTVFNKTGDYFISIANPDIILQEVQ